MGWKAVRDHYRIGHIVRIEDGRLLIGSPYVRDLVAVEADGTVVPNRVFRDDGELGRYRAEMEADRETLLGLLASVDSFERSVPVWTWRGAEIVEDACEQPGWPNVTHSGALMYDNTFSTDRDETVGRAIADALGAVPFHRESVRDARAELDRRADRLAAVEADLAILEARHPETADRIRTNRRAAGRDA